MRKQLELKGKVWRVLPYVYFIGVAAFWLLGDLFMIQKFSYVAFGISIGLTAQAIIQNKVVGTCLGMVAAIGSFIAFIALMSEFNDFEAFNNASLQLIAVGSLLTLSGLVMGVIMTVFNMNKRMSA